MKLHKPSGWVGGWRVTCIFAPSVKRCHQLASAAITFDQERAKRPARRALEQVRHKLVRKYGSILRARLNG